MNPIYIFDLDGTLALCGHRKHFLENKDDPERWRKFYAACDRDQPNIPVIAIMERLRLIGSDIWIFSGRSEEVRDKTLRWLDTYTQFLPHQLPESVLRMRRADDHRPDDILKQEWLDHTWDVDRKRIAGVFDDRDRVVKMWRDNGLPCFQVAPGDF